MADVVKQGGLLIDTYTMTASKTSDVLDVSDAGVAGLQFVAASATHVGTLTVELSIDGSTWDATSFQISSGASASSVAAASGSALAELVMVDVSKARRLRVKYTFTSGTGTLYVYGIAKSMAAMGSVTLQTGDLEIGAVEIKNAASDVRAVVQAASSAAAADLALSVADGNLHDSLGAVGAASDTDGVLHAQIRYGNDQLDTIAGDTTSVDAKTPDVAGQIFDATALEDQLALTTSADKSTQIPNGVYRICADADCYILQADTNVDTDLATYANGHFLPAGVPEWITVSGSTNDYLAALVVAGTGVLTISGPF